MANCLSKLKRKEQMIRYKKVLKASTKEHFTNIISAAPGLPAGLFRLRPCAAMRSGVQGAICQAKAHFLTNEYNKNPRSYIRAKIGINTNRHDGFGLQSDPSSLAERAQAGGAAGALPSFQGLHTPVVLVPALGAGAGEHQAAGDFNKEGRFDGVRVFRPSRGWKEPVPALSEAQEQFSTCLSDARRWPRGAQAAAASPHPPSAPG